MCQVGGLHRGTHREVESWGALKTDALGPRTGREPQEKTGCGARALRPRELGLALKECGVVSAAEGAVMQSLLSKLWGDCVLNLLTVKDREMMADGWMTKR